MKTRKEKLELIRTVLNKYLKKVASELEDENIIFIYGTLDSKNNLKEDVLLTSLLAIDKSVEEVEKLPIGDGLQFTVRDRLLYTTTDSITEASKTYSM